NVPVGAVVIVASVRVLIESRIEREVRRYDVPAAVSVTAGLMVLVYALVGTIDHGWTSGRSLLLFALAAGLIAVFLWLESRSPEPLLPLSIFRNRTLSGANVVGFLIGAGVFAMFYFLSFYMQLVLGFSPLRTGMSYLVFGFAVIASAGLGQYLVTRIGIRSVLATGLLMVAATMLWYTRLPVHGTYLWDLLPAFIVGGLGLGFAFVPDAIAALQGVPPERSGVASGLINTSQQVGGALGLGLLVTVSTTRTAHLARAASDSSPDARLGSIVGGFHQAFLVGAALVLLGFVLTLVMIRPAREDPTIEAVAEALEPAPAE
ncbi:MAG TPA: MFS transporter, partial [Actinomycetota bacterium]